MKRFMIKSRKLVECFLIFFIIERRMCFINQKSSQQSFLRVSRDILPLKSVRVNCSGIKKSQQKVLTLDATDAAAISDIYSKFFFVGVQNNLGYYDSSKLCAAQIGHMHQVMRPVIHMADESLEDLKVEQ
jgi:hypothetical protein